MLRALIILSWLLQASPVVLENDYVKVTKNGAPCAAADSPYCGDRVVVALTSIVLQGTGKPREMNRGEIAVFQSSESYHPPSGGDFLEVAFKPNHPPIKSPSSLIKPEKNTLLYDGARFVVFEEKLPPGETRARHSHSQRVVIVLNETKLRQWPEGGPEALRTQVVNDVRFNEPVIHVVKNVGAQPLRNIVIEFKP